MRTLRNAKSQLELNEAKGMAKYILTLLSGTETPQNDFFRHLISGRMPIILANYSSWGANKHKIIIAEDSSIGLQFNVSGLLFKGIVRVWYNYGSDYFDIELIKGGKSVKEFEDIDLENLHYLIHRNIEEK